MRSYDVNVSSTISFVGSATGSSKVSRVLRSYWSYQVLISLSRRSKRWAVSVVLLASSIFCNTTAIAQHSVEFEKKLYGNDAAAGAIAAKEIVKSAARADPIDIIAASIQFYRSREYELATFWFYTGYLRASYAYAFIPSQKAAAAGGILLSFQPDIDAKAMLDIGNMAAILGRVLAWEASTVDSWADQNAIDLKGDKFVQAHGEAIKRITELRQTILADREKFEKQAREYKTAEEKMREREEQFARDMDRYYTTAELERAAGPHFLKIPLNYFTPLGLKPGLVLPSAMPITLVLPSLQGMTRENWLSLTKGGALLDRLEVDMMHLRGDASHRRDNDGEQVDAMFKNFIASDPPKGSDMGKEFYVYDSAKSKMPLPRDGSNHRRVLSAVRTQDTFHLLCDTDYSPSRNTARCNAYFLDHVHGFYLRTDFPGRYVPIWAQIRNRFRALLDEWLVR